MKAEIVKLNSVTDNVTDFFSKMASKVGLKKNCEVTIIVKKGQEKTQTEIAQNPKSHDDSMKEIAQKVMRPKGISQRRRDSRRGSDLLIQRSTKSILPNVKINADLFDDDTTSYGSKHAFKHMKRPSIMNMVSDGEEVDLSKFFGAKMRKKSEPRSSVDKPQLSQKKITVKKVDASVQATEKERERSLLPTKQDPIMEEEEDRLLGSEGSQDRLDESRSDKKEGSSESQYDDYYDEDDDDDDSNPESQFNIQNRLNEAIKFIERDELYQLEDYLYDFKSRYNYLSDRIQVKWRLLMAYCKENRKEYERAAINYNQVIEIAMESPKSLTIDTADVNHRLGICYSQIKEWNSGIECFSKALTEYNDKRNIQKYAECINNLGTLYLNSGYVSEAEECFLSSYYIKQEHEGRYSIKLFSCLLNLYECNLRVRNYEQAESMLKVLEGIAVKAANNQLLVGSIFRRKGKLAFLSGQLKEADKNFSKCKDLLEEKYQYSLEYGELMNNIAILKLEQHQYPESKQFLERASILLNFYCSKESSAVKTLKKNMDLVNGYIKSSKKAN